MLTRYEQRSLTWVDLVAPSASEVRTLMQEFDLDPAIAEELLSVSFRSKVERRGDAILLILHYPSPRGSNRPTQEIDFVIGKHFLITAHYENIDPLHIFAKAFEVESVLGRPGTGHGGHLFVSVARNIYAGLVHECESIERKLQDIEDNIFRGNEREMVTRLSQVGRTIHDFRQALAPHQEMLASLEPVAGRFFGHEFSHYIREIEGSLRRVQHTIENLRDSLGELRETNNSLLNTKQNDIMKTFTVLAFLFLPLSFIAGLFGMNTENNPVTGHPHDFWVIFSGMAALGVSFIFYFKHKGWL